jgi:capsular exopolysaccharide synthesis family protein
MSHLFDALQRSETERSGIELPPLSAASELLEIAEHRAAVERERIASYDIALENEIALEGKPPGASRKPTQPPAAEIPPIETGLDLCSQFQSLQVSVPPQSRLVCFRDKRNHTDKENLAAEKFRFLGVRLRQLQQSRSLKKVLITSTIPEEGKSMVAANLACTLARTTQQKTLLIDGDLRRPSLAQLFSLGKIPGLTEWLQGEQGPMTSIYNLEGLNLWILPAGNIPSNPLELLQSGILSEVMKKLMTCFDWIVIDSPPVLPLADTSIWTRLADGVLLVARQGTTHRDLLKRGLGAIEPSKLLGAVLNSSTKTAASDYYYRPIVQS